MLSDAHFLAVAHIVADAGTCTRLKVGAVLVYARRIISTGYNGAPAGASHCYHQEGDDRPCTKAVHAEVNAIAFAAKHGVSTDGATLYTTDSPCVACAQLIINAGVKEVKYGSKYRDPSGVNILQGSGIRVTELGESSVRLMSVALGNEESLYPGQYAEQRAQERWGTNSPPGSGGSSGS